MIITPTMVRIAKVRSAGDRRKYLRKLVTPVMDNWSCGRIADACNISPIFGEGAGCIKFRKTPAGLRDVLNEKTLWMIALLRATAKEKELAKGLVMDAVERPQDYGVKHAGTKTGYAFGEPLAVKTDSLRGWVKSFATKAPAAEPGDRLYHVDIFRTDFSASGLAHFCDHVTLFRNLEDDMDHGVMADTHRDTEDNTDTDTEPKEEKPMVKRELIKFELPTNADQRNMIDFALKSAGLPTLEDIKREMDGAGEASEAATKAAAEVERLKKALATASAGSTAPKKVKGSGDIPDGRVEMRDAREVFGIDKKVTAFGFDVPVWTWDNDHPHVPEVDANYIFQSMPLLHTLRAIVRNERAWLKGHTGTGKTTLLEQVAARLNWPVLRINFDSEISRGDLVGRDTITIDPDTGSSVSKFADGMLPQMLSGPYIGILDEIDFVRPDVAYVMQAALEGNGMTVSEDGGRIITPNGWSRLFGTGNTAGQGDESGLYQGARPQSQAMLDRFAAFIEVDYMPVADRKRLIQARVPALSEELADAVAKYTEEHIEAFTSAKVLQPLSPRGFIALAQWLADYTELFPTGKRQRAVTEALNATILNRASSEDRAVLYGIAQRVFSL